MDSKGHVKGSSRCDCPGRSHLFHYQAIETTVPKGMEFPLEFQTERQNSLGPWTKPEEGFVSQKGLHELQTAWDTTCRRGAWWVSEGQAHTLARTA